jgi:hypothetical protein
MEEQHTFGETDEKISIVEEKKDVSELSMEKEEASEVTQLSCIVDKYSYVHNIAEQLDMLQNNSSSNQLFIWPEGRYVFGIAQEITIQSRLGSSQMLG